MITRTHLFADIICPFDSDCRRPNCHFWHSSEPRLNDVRTAKEETFMGYVGYVGSAVTSSSDLSSNSCSAIINSNSRSKTLDSRFQENIFQRTIGVASKRLQKKLGLSCGNSGLKSPLQLSVPKVVHESGSNCGSKMVGMGISVDTKQVSRIREERIGEPVRSGMMKLPRSSREKEVNFLIKSVASIDTRIEHLKRKIVIEEKEKEKIVKEIKTESVINDVKGDYVPTKKSLLELESKYSSDVLHTSTSNSYSGGYTPTPIAVLNSVKKRRGEIVKEKNSLISVKKESLPTSSKSSTKIDTSLSVEDLFDEKPQEKKAKISSTRSVTSLTNNAAPSVISVQPRIAALKPGVNRIASTTTRIPNPSQQLSIRYAKLQKEKEEIMKKVKERTLNSNKSNAKEEIEEKTAATTIEKGGNRIAHKVNDIGAKKLLVLDAFKPCKVPYSTRTQYLDLFYKEYLRITNSIEEAITQAQNEEKRIKDRAQNKVVYCCSAVNTLKNLRNRNRATATTGMKTVSHAATLAGRHNGSFTILNRSLTKMKAAAICERDFYTALSSRHLMTKIQLNENGFPCWDDDEKLIVKIPPSNPRPKTIVGNDCLRRVCSRCGKEFLIKSNGEYTTVEQCIYHSGRCYKERRTWIPKYCCCAGTLSDAGCCIADNHVTDAIPQSVLSMFKATPPPEGPDDSRSTKVFALDCEMVYTVWGLALARVTVVDFHDELALDILVRQTNEVIDYNTHFSGLTKKQLESAECDLDQARDRLFSLINSETILIGHGLENDMIALRIVHDRIVDTSIAFPHRLGHHMKYALRTIASRELDLIIQANENGGHDSKEDSSTCMKLMLHKVKRG